MNGTTGSTEAKATKSAAEHRFTDVLSIPDLLLWVGIVLRDVASDLLRAFGKCFTDRRFPCTGCGATEDATHARLADRTLECTTDSQPLRNILKYCVDATLRCGDSSTLPRASARHRCRIFLQIQRSLARFRREHCCGATDS